MGRIRVGGDVLVVTSSLTLVQTSALRWEFVALFFNTVCASFTHRPKNFLRLITENAVRFARLWSVFSELLGAQLRRVEQLTEPRLDALEEQFARRRQTAAQHPKSGVPMRY